MPKTPPQHSIVHGDEIYFSHPEHGPLCGPVCAIGKDGVQVRHEAAGEAKYLPVTWDSVHGHKARKERAFTLIDQGEDGAIAEDDNGQRVYLHGDIPDDEPDEEIMRKSVSKPIPLLFFKGGMFPPRPEKDEADKDSPESVEDTKEPETEQEQPEPDTTQGMPENPPAVGDLIKFKCGDFAGKGEITAVGDDGVTIQDSTGREHGIHWDEVIGVKRQAKPEEPENDQASTYPVRQ